MDFFGSGSARRWREEPAHPFWYWRARDLSKATAAAYQLGLSGPSRAPDGTPPSQTSQLQLRKAWHFNVVMPLPRAHSRVQGAIDSVRAPAIRLAATTRSSGMAAPSSRENPGLGCGGRARESRFIAGASYGAPALTSSGGSTKYAAEIQATRFHRKWAMTSGGVLCGKRKPLRSIHQLLRQSVWHAGKWHVDRKLHWLARYTQGQHEYFRNLYWWACEGMVLSDVTRPRVCCRGFSCKIT
jgi:hypothetical protein